MREGLPSRTAQGVAAARLTYERLDAPYADPAGDEALARDIASGRTGGPDGQMDRYLRLRTAFFDRVVVNAIERSVGQIVVVGAGYDGRALRYPQTGVSWWEVDHPDTQADKQERLARLGIAAPHLRWVPHDLERRGLSRALLDAGLEPDAPSLFYCEGVVVYLTPGSVTSLLLELRALGTPGTRLAISLPVPSTDPEIVARRERRSATMAAIGEPMPSQLDLGEPEDLLQAARWRRVDTSERSQRAGLLVAVPEWAPPPPGAPATAGPIAGFVERTLWRGGTDQLGQHLESTYGVQAKRVRELDLGVFRVDLADRRTWVARVSPAVRSLESVRGDAELLTWLGDGGYPAERPVAGQPVSEHRGQGVIVTEFARGRPPGTDPAAATKLGQLLGRLHALAPGCPAAERQRGAWHHLLPDGSSRDELPAIRGLLHDARHRVRPGEREAYDELGADLDGLDDCCDLPQVLVHADFVPRNVLGPVDDPTVIDWSGAGRGPRVVSLGCLLWSLAGRQPSVAAATAAYTAIVRLEKSELDALENAMRIRPLVLAAWAFATGRGGLGGVTDRWHAQRRSIGAAAATARAEVERLTVAESERGADR